MYYIQLNDASLFEVTDIIKETTTELNGETLKALAINIQNADQELIRSSFLSEFNTRTVTLLSEGKVPMTVYNNYTILRRIATDEVAMQEEPKPPVTYLVILAQPSDIGKLVPQLQERIGELEQKLIEATAEPDPSQMNLEELKKYQVAMSKINLEKYLAANPVKSSVHGGVEKEYACTREKQMLLNNAIAMAEIHKKTGDEMYKISWNATGEECSFDWTLDELVQLAIELEKFVKPNISVQQLMEQQITDATSKEEVMKVSIEFPAMSTHPLY